MLQRDREGLGECIGPAPPPALWRNADNGASRTEITKSLQGNRIRFRKQRRVLNISANEWRRRDTDGRCRKITPCQLQLDREALGKDVGVLRERAVLDGDNWWERRSPAAIRREIGWITFAEPLG